MIRIECENPDSYTIEQIRSAAEDWASSYSQALTSESYSIRELQSNPDSSADSVFYLVGYWRFSYDEDETTLLDDIEARLQEYVSWAVIRYHGCDHDGDANASCSWNSDKERVFGTDPR